MTPQFAIGLRLAVMLAVGAAAMAAGSLPGADRVVQQGADRYRLSLPARVRKGEETALILRVERAGRPAEDAVACMDPVPIFASEEDIADTTPALGADLGVGAPSAAAPACVAALAAVRTAPGVYRFTWEPDAAGRIDLRFTVGDSRFHVPIDVASPPADPAIPIAFVLLAGAFLGTAAWMRRTRKRSGGAK